MWTETDGRVSVMTITKESCPPRSRSAVSRSRRDRSRPAVPRRTLSGRRPREYSIMGDPGKRTTCCTELDHRGNRVKMDCFAAGYGRTDCAMAADLSRTTEQGTDTRSRSRPSWESRRVGGGPSAPPRLIGRRRPHTAKIVRRAEWSWNSSAPDRPTRRMESTRCVVRCNRKNEHVPPSNKLSTDIAIYLGRKVKHSAYITCLS